MTILAVSDFFYKYVLSFHSNHGLLYIIYVWAYLKCVLSFLFVKERTLSCKPFMQFKRQTLRPHEAISIFWFLCKIYAGQSITLGILQFLNVTSASCTLFRPRFEILSFKPFLYQKVFDQKSFTRCNVWKKRIFSRTHVQT